MRPIVITAFLLFAGINLFSQTVQDVESNSYKTVQVGTQTWFAENLKVTKAPDGAELKSWAPNGADSLVAVYGRIYDWESAVKACPAGWHLPSDKEFMELVKFLGGAMVAGGAMKETGTDHWKSPNKGATNSSGLTVLPGGYRSQGGRYLNYKNNLAYFWSSTENDSSMAWGYYLTYGEPIIYRFSMTFTKPMGMAVRCIK